MDKKNKPKDIDKHDGWLPPGSLTDMLVPRIYGDTPSMMEVPIAYEPDDLKGADAVFLGIPWEGGHLLDSANFATFGERPPDPDAIISRGGAYKAPEWLRKYSVHHTIKSSGWRWPEFGEGFALPDYLDVVDYRDVEVKEYDVEETAHRAIEKVADIVKAGAIPLVIGGDHSIPYMTMRAISDNTSGKTGIIWFDTHYDLVWCEDRLTSGNQLHRIFHTCEADPSNLVLVGIHGTQNMEEWELTAKGIGSTVFTMGDVEEMGIEEVIARSIEIAGRDTERIYVSLDVDVLDPIHFPAQKYPHPFGITSHQIRTALRMISREANLAGLDMCCIGPDYDFKGISAMTANRLFVEALAGMALRMGKKVREK
jgi:agmatinase